MVPCYNEEEVLPLFYQEITRVAGEMPDYAFEFVFVDDGSKDGTMKVVKEMAAQDERVKYISFSRNFGKEAAMYAGFSKAAGDYVTLMDADLQDPPALLPEMVKAIEEEGYDSVATRRVTRKGEPPIRSFFARRFYALMRRISKTEIVDGARDYRLMTRQFVNSLLELGEYNRFSKGLYGWVGYKTKWLEYENVERAAGETVARLVQPLDSTYDTGYDVETTVESIPLENIVSTRANLDNVQFRVVAYRTDASSADHYAGTAVYKTNGSGVAAIVAKTATPVNSAGQWILGPGTYTFVCYSYGLNSAPAMLSGNWSATVSHNQDFMLCRKEGVVVAPDDRGEFTLGGISFTRQCALLQLAVTANDFTNNTVQQCAATVSNLNSNSITWNAGQTALSTGGTGGAVNFSWSILNAVTVSSNVYKVLPQNSRTLTIKLTTLRIGNIQYNNRVTVNASGRQFAAGGNYKITVKITGNGITVGGATWAKGNVYKSGNNFYFESSQSGYHSGTQGGSFFGWNTTSSDNNTYGGSSFSSNNDPCDKVAPQHTWCTPTANQLQNLGNSGYRSGYLNSKRGGFFGGDKVFLPAIGNRGKNNVNYWPETGYYRSSTGASGQRCYYLEFNQSYAVKNNYYWYWDGFPIRCVKR